jgi:cation diffusion facilitator family transporter
MQEDAACLKPKNITASPCQRKAAMLESLKRANHALGKHIIPGFDQTDDQRIRIKHGLLAGWASIIINIFLFVIKIVMGLMSGSISIVADAFHLLSHLANSIILVVTFWVSGKPSTAHTPYGHGRMEHIGPLIMSIFLFVSGIQIAEKSFHQALHPQEIHYWPGLPWILLATVFAKYWMEQFVLFLGRRVDSRAIIANARHQRIEAISTLTVIVGLLSGYYLHINEADGYIGIAVSIWILYLGYSHGRHAIIPLLGKAPERDLIQRIRETAKSVKGISDVHEIIVHDYGSMYLISLHGEIPEKFGPAKIHEIAEHCEAKLRARFGGEAVCHSDPLQEKTKAVIAIEERFKQVVAEDTRIVGYHDFRIVSANKNNIIIVADIDVSEEIPESEFNEIAEDLERRSIKSISNLSYCTFYVTPRFAY